MSLENWERVNQWLVAHQTSRDEIQNLVAVGDRNLRDSAVDALSADSQMALAYGGALQFATAALSASGYRPSRGGDHHYRGIQSLAYTLNWSASSISRLDGFRKKRNLSSYERAGEVSTVEAAEMRTLAARLRADLFEWLKKEHPEFL